MTMTVRAVYDGKVFRPEEPIELEPNTSVTITLETNGEDEKEPTSFLELARTLKLHGPPDWSERIEDYLYHGYNPENK